MARELLLIESDPELAESVRRAFGPAGFHVTTLSAGEAAVDRCRASRPDLILLAAELPDMSGFSVCNRIKRSLASVPLILYTSEASEGAIEAHRQSRTRADEYVRTPLDLVGLLGRASELVQNGAAEGSSQASPAQPGRTGAAPPPIPGAAATPPAPPPRPRPPPPPRDAAPRDGDLFAEWPRDPSPPRGTPEEKLEFFRERLRVKDTFLARVKDSVAAQRQDAAELRTDIESLRRDLADGERTRTTLEQQLAQARAGGEEVEKRRAELEARLADSETTRQSLSDVLSETMQASEASEQAWSQRLAEADDARTASEQAWTQRLADADDARAQLEAAALEERSAATATLEAERAARDQTELEHGFERQELEARLASLSEARDGLAGDVARLGAELEQERSRSQAEREAQAQAMAVESAEKDAARARGEELAQQLAEARERGEALDQELSRERDARGVLTEELGQSRAEATGQAEKALAAEQANRTLEADLGTARASAADLARALEESQSSAAAEASRLQGALGEAGRREAQLAAEREDLSRKLATEVQRHEAARAQAATLESEVQRLAALEPQAAEAPRLRRELGHAQELLQQRTQQAEAAARAAHQATADRERVKEQAAVEIQGRVSELARVGSEMAALRRRAAELETERTTREAHVSRLLADAEAQRRTISEEALDAERRHASEVQRMKASMVELERRLEASGRAEGQGRRRIAELEKERAEHVAQQAQLVVAEEALARAGEELQDLKSENDFLNGEVARYHQKNKDLLGQGKKG